MRICPVSNPLPIKIDVCNLLYLTRRKFPGLCSELSACFIVVGQTNPYFMNTKLIMSASAILLGAVGVFLTFAPDALLIFLKLDVNPMTLLTIQILGAMYIGFAMLNWMTKGALIGGIYSRPTVVANLTHYIIAALALTKSVIAHPSLPIPFLVTTILYAIFAAMFGILLFRHPIPDSNDAI